jgi:S-adenosylmethionine hydrolase
VNTLRIITLLTDFGTKDGYHGVMKGVIWGIAPGVKIADITHQISPQNVLEGALAYSRVAHFFPPGTIHVGVVDPGVGTARRPIAAQIGSQFFVGPDNGLCTLLVQQSRQQNETVRFVKLDQPKYWLSEVSNVFHGRDIFSPVAAHLANGVVLGDLGSPIDDPRLLQIPEPERTANGWRGQIVIVDNFGNLSSNLRHAHLAGLDDVTVEIAGQSIHGLLQTFGEGQPGELVALFGEADDLAVCVVNGDAARRLNVRVGEPLVARSR